MERGVLRVPELIVEMDPQPAPGAVQALAKTVRRHPEYRSGLRGCKPIPGHERERLSIALGKTRERSQDGSVLDVELAGVIALDMPVLGLEP